MSFVYELRQYAFRDILPINSRFTVAKERNSTHVSIAFGTVIAGGVDCLHLNRDELLQCSFWGKQSKNPIDKVGTSATALRKVQLATPSFSKYSNIFSVMQHPKSLTACHQTYPLTEAFSRNLKKDLIICRIKTNWTANDRAGIDLLNRADAAYNSITERLRALITKKRASRPFAVLDSGLRGISYGKAKQFSYADRHSI